MKKIFSIFLCAAFVFALSVNLFAGWIDFDPDNTVKDFNFRPSNGVFFYYDASATTNSDNTTNYQEYIIGTKHASGDTVYGSSSGDSNIYKAQSDDYIGQNNPNVTFPTAGASDFANPWEKM